MTKRLRVAALIALGVHALYGCTSLDMEPAALAQSLEFERLELEGRGFSHTAYRNAPVESATAARLWVFIEGDGRPWIEGGRTPAQDPTTRRPLALALAGATQGDVLYMSRPCYERTIIEPACTTSMWTDARYSSTVIESMAQALSRYRAERKYDRVVLVGYSGGGVLAVLMAPFVEDLEAVVTVAANLDVAAWTAHHGYLPLAASLDPASAPASDVHWREFHLLGGEDKVVPPSTARRYFEQRPAARAWTYREYDHVCCWVKAWPDIQVRIERELTAD